MSETERGDLQIYESSADLAAALAARFAESAEFSITERGAFYVALAGGSTPAAAYEVLAGEPYSTQINWNDVFLYFGDERCVAPDDAQSNYGLAQRTLFERIKIPAHNIHRMHGEDEPARAAQAYTRILKEDLGELPRFDLIMLGMGPDGHTASLFPGSHPSMEETALVIAPYVEALKSHRLTLTPRVINNARHVVIATQGAGKAAALASALHGPIEANVHPVQIVNPSDGTLTWMVDRLAASELHA